MQVDKVASAQSVRVETQSLTPASIAAAVAAEQSFTGIPWALAGDVATVVPPSIGTAVAPVYARCAVAGTLIVCWVNATAGILTPSAGAYTFIVARA